MAVKPSPRLFTVGEYYQMGKAGILTQDDRVELVEGEIIQMPPIGSPHASGVKRVTRLFYHIPDLAAVVSVQDPLHLSDRSEPEPDFMLLRPRHDLYASEHPTAADVLLLVEVSESTLAYDQRVKAALYARSRIPEVWVMDVNGDRLLVHRDPSPDGYREIITLGHGDHVSPLAFPNLDLAVDDILG